MARITSDEFDTVAAELSNALDAFNVPEREKQEVLAAFAAHKGRGDGRLEDGQRGRGPPEALEPCPGLWVRIGPGSPTRRNVEPPTSPPPWVVAPGSPDVPLLRHADVCPGFASPQPQVTFILSKLTVTVPLAFMVKTVVWCAVIDDPSVPLAWIVSVNALF